MGEGAKVQVVAPRKRSPGINRVGLTIAAARTPQLSVLAYELLRLEMATVEATVQGTMVSKY